MWLLTGRAGTGWPHGPQGHGVTATSNRALKSLRPPVIMMLLTLKPGRSDVKVKNITDISQKTLRIADLQGKTSYHLVLRAYTNGGLGPEKSMFVVTKENCESRPPETLPVLKCTVFLAVFVCVGIPSSKFHILLRFYSEYKAVLKGHLFLLFEAIS